MCGIWATFGVEGGISPTCLKCFMAIKHRGPDAWRIEQDAREPLAILGFQRLSIVDSLHGMQPMRLHSYPRVTLVCNGEIYNYKKLQKTYNYPYETKCDVEAIIHGYKNLGIEEMIRNLDGVFGFCLVDGDSRKVILGRDPYGVRPLFKFEDNENGVLAICSEAKGLIDLKMKGSKSSTLAQFQPGTFEIWSILDSGKVKFEAKERYFFPGIEPRFLHSYENGVEILNNKQPNAEAILAYLQDACRKRLMSDRRIGCLLSGGLDSSIITSIVVKLAKEQKLPYKIQTFAIGMGDSPDLAAAKTVAEYLGTEHHEVRFDENDVKQVLDEVIYHLESYDITTIRASTPMYILSKYIKENTDTTVIFSGEGADELAQGYIYFRDAPSAMEANEESIRLLENIYLYDGLRADRTTSAFSLELRVPFLDLLFTYNYLKMEPQQRQPQNGVEKHFLRKMIAETGLLPDSIVWRQKEAFSDGVASVKKSLFTTIAEIISERSTGPSDDSVQYEGVQPITPEARYYRRVFETFFPGQHNFTPYYWMPKWVQVSDPSARFINHYTAS